MELANVIRENRRLNNWSQDELANILKVSKQSVSNWEDGKNYPPIDILITLSDLFKIPLDQLVKEDEDFKRDILNGGYKPEKRKNSTLYNIYADFWWTIFPVGGFLVWVIHSLT